MFSLSPDSPTAFSIWTPLNFTWDCGWGEQIQCLLGPAVKCMHLRMVILSNTRLKCRAPECYPWSSIRHQELLPSYHLLLGWMLEKSACLGLAALVPNEQLKPRRKGKTGMCSSVSAGDYSCYSRVKLVSARVPTRFIRTTYHSLIMSSHSPSRLCTQHLHQ